LDVITESIKGTNIQILRVPYTTSTDWDDIGNKRVAFINSLKAGYADMTAANTVIIGAIGESPYAEFMGDVGTVYCRGHTEYVEGCIYNSHINEYMPLQQNVDLTLIYDRTAQDVHLAQPCRSSLPLVRRERFLSSRSSSQADPC
jgi:beta-glucosidase